MQRCPVIIVSGFPDEGKQAYLKQLVDDLGDSQVAMLTCTDQGTGEFGVNLRVGNGDHEDVIGVTGREALVRGVVRALQDGVYRPVLIDAHPGADPEQIAKLFSHALQVRGMGVVRLRDSTRLASMVAVIDASTLLDDFGTSERLLDRGVVVPEGDTRGVADVLVQQVEFTDVVLLTHLDGLPLDQQALLRAILAALNPDALVLAAGDEVSRASALIQSDRFDVHGAARSASWVKLINEESIPGESSFGLSSFVYSARRPFHPERLSEWMKQSWSGVIRACGFCWLENDPESVSQLTVAGGSRRIRRAGTWWVGSARKYWPRDKERLTRMRESWHPDFGDRVQEIAVIGIHLDEASLRAGFDAALLTEQEVQEGGWTRSAMTPDPFFGLL